MVDGSQKYHLFQASWSMAQPAMRQVQKFKHSHYVFSRRGSSTKKLPHNAFGGCSILRSIDGSYQSSQGFHVRDRMAVVYTDIGIRFEDNFDGLSRYADRIRNAAYEALEEEKSPVAILCPCSGRNRTNIALIWS